MSEQREAIGFRDDDGVLCQWLVDQCQVWAVSEGVLYCSHARFVLWPDLFRMVGKLACEIDLQQAAELLLGSGHELPCGLLRYLGEQNDKPKIEKRSKPRRPRRPPKAQHGLTGFADSKRQRDSRAGNPEPHEREIH